MKRSSRFFGVGACLAAACGVVISATSCGQGEGPSAHSTGNGSGSSSSGTGGASSGSAGTGGMGVGAGGAGGAVEPLGPLPPPASVTSPLFTSADRCAMCHEADTSAAMRDAKGRDVSPYSLWKSSMMAFAGRDPYYFSALSHELDDRPGAKDVIETTCTRCHAPEGATELAGMGAHLGLTDITSGDRVEDKLAREGIACTACHQILPDNLGDPSSFTGHYQIGTQRQIFGPHQNPFPNPMQMMVNYTPTFGDHVRSSELCATCHTVVTRALDANGKPNGPEFYEQAPYLEWKNSSFASGAGTKSCASCHMPVVDEDGNPINARISNRPPWLDPRSPFGRHTIAGGNAYMLDLLADNTDWLNAGVPAADIKASSARDQVMLEDAATIEIVSATRSGGSVAVTVRVVNKSGHKFPTAYPSRRAFVHLTVLDGKGKAVFESGRIDATGAIVDASGKRLDELGTVIPHRDTVSSDAEVVVYEAVMIDKDAAPTHTLLSAVGYAKDNRLLPAGYSSSHADAAKTNPVGVSGDSNFGQNADDTIRYQIASAPTGALSVKVELLFQTVTPGTLDAFAAHPTPASVRFLAMTSKKPPVPRVVASASAAIP